VEVKDPEGVEVKGLMGSGVTGILAAYGVPT
jgi:hypothetical protein